jgi:hypothetical protein
MKGEATQQHIEMFIYNRQNGDGWCAMLLAAVNPGALSYLGSQT